MRGWRTDFTPYTRSAPSVINFMPPDFDPADVERYATQPLAPEVRACVDCQSAACHHALRTTGQPLRAACAPLFELPAHRHRPPHPLDGIPATPGNRRPDPDGKRAAILAALADGKLLSVYEIIAATGINYASARKYVNLLLRAGRIAQGATRKGHGNGTLILYCLSEHLPAAPVRGPRKPRCYDAAQERSSANNARLLDELRSRPMSAAELAARTGMTPSAVRMKLALFVAAGTVESAGYESYQPARAYFTTRTRELWRIREDA